VERYRRSKEQGMFAVEVRDHMMIAHSFKAPLFGPAQRMHGATYVIDVAFFRERLTADGVVVDIGRAHQALKATLAPLNYQNLDALPQFKGAETTTEYLAKYIFDALAQAARAGELGEGGTEISKIRVTLHESHIARAWFEAAIA
jgi:6-pyruvoyl-tetrahydropterin synthase